MTSRKRPVAAYHNFDFGADRPCPCGDRMVTDCRGLQGGTPRSGACRFDAAPLRERARAAAERYLHKPGADAPRRAPSAGPTFGIAIVIVAAMGGSAYIAANLIN
jgi:hypothetical protein